MGCGASSMASSLAAAADGQGQADGAEVAQHPASAGPATASAMQRSQQEVETGMANSISTLDELCEEGSASAPQAPKTSLHPTALDRGQADGMQPDQQRARSKESQDAEKPCIHCSEASQQNSASATFSRGQTTHTSNSPLLDTLRAQMEAGFSRRSEPFVRQVFDRYTKAAGTPGVPKDDLLSALADLGIAVNESESEEVFRTYDVNVNGWIDFSEFCSIAATVRGIGQWASTLPLAQLLADCMPTKKEEADPVQAVSCLSPTDIVDIVTCFSEGLGRTLNEEVGKLKRAYESMKRKADSSQVPAKFTLLNMECGSIQDFHQGLSARVGDPHLDFEKAMEAEHCHGEGSKAEFTAGNYGVTTCAYNEWQIAVHHDISTADKSDGKRRFRKIDELLDQPGVKSANLRREEVIAVVLYTGGLDAHIHVYMCMHKNTVRFRLRKGR
jgi:hypothetical protein